MSKYSTTIEPVLMESTILNGKRAYAPRTRQLLLDFLQSYEGILVALNAEKVLIDNDQLMTIINDNLGYPDGIGVVKALRRKGFKTTKIPGAELWLDIIDAYYKTKSFYIIGSSEQVIKETVAKLRQRHEHINLLGYRNGYINSEEGKKRLMDDIVEKKPDVVFVAQGSPRQEFLMEELYDHHRALYMGLGGSFDVYCGKKNRAPSFFIDLGLEWFYRLIIEPTRIKRQLVLWKFMYLLILGRI